MHGFWPFDQLFGALARLGQAGTTSSSRVQADSRPSTDGLVLETAKALYSGAPPLAQPLFEAERVRQSEAPPRDTCVYNETHCACDRMHVDTYTTDAASICFSYAKRDPESGQRLCRRSTCPTSTYRCTCDGQLMCRHESNTRSEYLIDSGQEQPDDEGLWRCQKKRVLQVFQISGATTEAVERRPFTFEFNQTHCTCVQKITIIGSQTCFDLVKTETRSDGEVDSFCVARKCSLSPSEMVCDMAGDSLCERAVVPDLQYRRIGQVRETALMRRARNKTLEVRLPRKSAIGYSSTVRGLVQTANSGRMSRTFHSNDCLLVNSTAPGPGSMLQEDIET